MEFSWSAPRCHICSSDKLSDTAIDRIFGELHVLYRGGKKYMGYLVGHEATS